MNLEGLVSSAISGAIMGVLVDRYLIRKHDEEREYMDHTVSHEERKVRGLDVVEQLGKRLNSKRINFPLYGCLLSSAFVESATGEGMQNLYVALPFAYLGSFASELLRSFKRRERTAELKIIKKIIEDPENTLDYLPEEDRKFLKPELERMERMIFSGEKPDNLDSTISHFKDRDEIYADQIETYLCIKEVELYGIQELRAELEVPEVPSEIKHTNVQTLQVGDSNKVIAWSVSNACLTEYHLIFDKLRIVRIDGSAGGNQLQTSEPRLERKFSVPRDKDTTIFLAKAIYRERNKKSYEDKKSGLVLLTSLEEIPESRVLQRVYDNYCLAFANEVVVEQVNNIPD